MPTTLAAQLAALELGHLSIASDPGARPLARPEPEAIDQTLAAVCRAVTNPATGAPA